MRVGIIVQVLAILLLSMTTTAADAPQMINYQGRLVNSIEQGLPDLQITDAAKVDLGARAWR